MTDSPFDRSNAAEDEARLGGFVSTPWDRLQKRAIDKRERLNASSDARLNALRDLQARRTQGEASVAGQLDLNEDGLPHTAVNTAASVVSAGSRTLGNLASAGVDSVAMAQESIVPEDAFAAYGRYMEGNASDADIQLLQSEVPAPPKKSQPSGNVLYDAGELDVQRGTYLDVLHRAAGAREAGNAVTETMDISHIVDQRKRRALSDDLAKGGKEGINKLRQVTTTWDRDKTDAVAEAVSGIADLVVAGGDALINNKAAGAEYLAEMTPDLALGAVNKGLMGASSLGYGLENYRAGINKYRAENNGDMPDEDTRHWMALNAFGAALGDLIGEASILKGAKAGKADAENSTSKIGDISRGFVVEGTTEGAQGYMEGEARLTPATGTELFENAAIGAASGGGIATGIASAQKASEIKQTAKATDTVGGATETHAELRDAAIESGDVSSLMEADTPNHYNPTYAAAALVSRINNPELQDNLRATAKSQLNGLASILETQIEYRDTELEGTADEAKIAEIGKAQKIDKAHLARVSSAIETVNADTAPTTENVTTLVDRVNSPEDSPERQQAAEQLIHAMMDDADVVDLDTIQSLANNATEGFSPSQQDYLRKAADARTQEVELKSAGQVHQDVINGGTGFKGLTQYRAEISKSLALGATNKSESQLADLRKFLTHFTAKQALLTQALEDSTTSNKPVYMLRVPGKPEWELTQDKPEGWVDRGYNPQGWQIHSGSSPLLQTVENEVQAIRSTLAELEAASELRNPTAEPEIQQPEQPVDTSAEQEVAEVADSETQESDLDAELIEALKARLSPEDVSKVGIPEGTVSALQDEHDKVDGNLSNEALGTTNLVKAYFTQEPAKDATTERPLVGVKDFLTEITNDPERLQEFLDTGEITPEQQNVIQQFIGFAQYFTPRIEQSLRKVDDGKYNAAWRHRDFLQFLRNDLDDAGNPKALESGEQVLDENVKTAIALGAFTYIIENGGVEQINDSNSIRSLLGKDSNSPLSESDISDFAYVGVRDKLVINSMGKVAAEALNLKATKAAPDATQGQLEGALGAYALELLLRDGFAERHNVYDERLHGEKPNGNKAAPHPFVRLATNPEVNAKVVRPEAGEMLTNIAQSAKGAGSVVQRLFSVQANLQEPSFTQQPFEQQFAKRTKQSIPSNLKEILSKVAERPHKIRKDVLGVMDSLDFPNLMSVAGANASDRTYLAVRQKGVDAKNAAIERSLERASNFVTQLSGQSDGLDTPFWYMPNVWRQQRVGLVQNSMDPQGDKVQRHMVSMDGWSREIDPTKPGKDLTYFKLAVAQALGIKTDKQLNTSSLAEFDALLENSETQDAINALLRSKTLGAGEKLSANEQASIVTAVREAGEAMHSLDGLINLAEYQEALTNGETFTTSLMYEVDGVTNGPALAHVLLGTLMPGLAERFGMYSAEGPQGFTEWKSKSTGQDLYEVTASRVDQAMAALLSQEPKLQNTANSIYYFMGTFSDKSARNRMKAALTPLVFGSSVGNAVEAMADSFVDTVYEKLEDQLNSQDWQGLRTSVDTLNQLLPPNQKLDIRTSQQVRNVRLSPEQLKAVHARFKDTVGAGVEQTLDSFFEEFMTRRAVVNTTAQGAFELFNTAYEHLREQHIKDKVAAGDVAYAQKKDGTKEARQSLTSADEASILEELKDVLPVAHTAMSKLADELDSGLLLSKLGSELASDAAYSQEVTFAEAFNTTDPTRAKQTSAKLHARTSRKTHTSPGVAPMIMLVHALDSAIAAHTYRDFDALHIHDAEGFGVRDVVAGAKSLNKNTFDFLLNYDLPGEVAATLERTLKGYDQLAAKYPELVDLKLDAQDRLQESGDTSLFEGANAPIENLLNTAKADATTAQNAKLDFLASRKVFDQYALEDGGYTLTPEDREAIAAMKATTPAATPKQTNAQATATPMPKPEPQIEAGPHINTWGTLGRPNRESLDSLVSAFNTQPKMPAKKAAEVLKKAISDEAYRASPRIRKFQLQLLAQVSRLASEDLTVELVTPTTPVDSPEVAKQVNRARGWYRKDTNTIQVKNTEFVESGLTPDMLLHELVHAVTATKIKESPESQEVQELEHLLVEVRSYIEANNLRGYGNATQDIHELLAWGLTSESFQRDVLNNVAIISSASERASRSGLKVFIDALVGLLFKGSKKSERQLQTNGLAVLVQNAGLLFTDPRTEDVSDPEVFQMIDSDPRSFSTDQVFEALGQAQYGAPLDKAYSAHLKSVLAKTVKAAYGAFEKDKAPAERRTGLTAEDTFLNALVTGELPFVSKSITRLKLSVQEAFVLESVEVTVAEAINTSATLRDEVRRTFEDARAAMSAKDFLDGDWAIASDEAKQEAKDTYHFLFHKSKNTDGTSDYLSRFVAASLAHKPLHDRLNQLPVRTTTSFRGMSLGEVIQEIFQRIMDQAHYWMTRTTRNQKNGDRLSTLAQRMAQVEGRRKAALLKDRAKGIEALEQRFKGLAEGARNKVEAFGRKPFFKTNRSGIVRALGSGVSAVAAGRGDMVFDNVLKLRDNLVAGRHDVMTSILTEMRGRTDQLGQMFAQLNMANKHDQDKQAVKESLATLTVDGFSQTLNNKQAKALTRAFIRTDVGALLGTYSTERLETLMTNDKELAAEIQKFEVKLQGKHQKYYVRAAKDLGYHLATGKTVGEHLMLNAHNIAHLAGTGREAEVTPSHAAQAWNTLDPLISLYAIKYLDGNLKKEATEVLITENRRTDGGNGVHSTLQFHNRLKGEALSTLFNGNPVHVMKGYTRETYNPHVRVEVANASDGLNLERAGYVRDSAVPVDPRDPNQETRHLYVMKHGGNEPWVTGAISLSGKRNKGSAIHSGATSATRDLPHFGNKATNRSLEQKTKPHIDAMFNAPLGYDPRAQQHNPTNANRLVPILNEDMAVVNYRYLMEDATRDRVLERNDRIDVVMGSMASSLFDKAHSEPMNKKVIEILHQQYRDDYALHPERYVEFGPDSNDPQVKETYQLLPEATKIHIKRTWGRNGMLVRKDVLHMTFGYRKFAASYAVKDLMNTEEAERTVMQQFMVRALEIVLGKKAWLKIRRAGDAWQEVVKAVKDIWVVKNLVTLVGNVMSNTSMLIWMGVPITDIVKNHVVALQGIINHRRDQQELSRLQEIVRAGVSDTVEERQRMVELSDSLARNPIKELIDAGLFQTIVEDVDTSEDDYSYKSRLVQGIDARTQWVPSPIKTVTKTLLMTHDTPLYKLLNRGTQFSDFMARYTLHQHMINRRSNPMSRENSLNLAQEAFVNYDIPTHPALQYANDMGLLPFTKYYLRIQKVILMTYREQPARALGLGLVESFFPMLDTILDAAFWGRLGNNPLSIGALHLPGSLPEIATIKGLMWPFK